MREQQNYIAGIYCRLSSEDSAEHESMSIGNQKAMLTDYVKRQGWEIGDIYIDMYPPKMIQFNLSPPGGEGVEKISPP